MRASVSTIRPIADALLYRQASIIRPRCHVGLPDRLSQRHASSSRIPTQSTPQAPLMMPGNMPREDYAGPAMYTLSYLSRILRFLLYGAVGISTLSIVSFEGLHYYIENYSMSVPSRSPPEGDGEYAWQSENQGWTGGARGGTDPRLGWKARHALRGAWICQEWGAGAAPGAIGKATSGGGGGLHPDISGGQAGRGMIGSRINRIDRGYELAEEYVELAINQARKKGLVFPPTLPSVREPGPPLPGDTVSSLPQGDPAVLDLLLLKAGILERISTPDALHQAKDLYEQVLVSINRTTIGGGVNSPAGEARVMRLAGKVGDLCSRIGEGEEALNWWGWGLNRAGILAPKSVLVEEIKEIKEEAKGWFGSRRSPKSPVTTSAPTIPDGSSLSMDFQLPPPILRATINLLISASAYHAMSTNHLPLAASLQSTALSILPDVAPSRIPNPTPSTAASTLHTIWMQHRTALLTLHAASVAHARGVATTDPLEKVTSASTSAESIVTALNPLPSAYTMPKSNPLITSANRLKRDSLLLAAEAAYTRGLLIERSLKTSSTRNSATTKSKSHSSDERLIQPLELAAECFERAMTLSLLEAGGNGSSGGSGGQGGQGELEEGAGRGEDWARYYRGFARVREKIDKITEGLVGDGNVDH